MNLPEILKRDYVQSILMIAVVILAVFLFWYGLRFAYNIENPLLAVASGSMEPVLYEGDLILVEGIQNFSDIHAAPKEDEIPGDIVVYQRRDKMIVHRVIDMEYVNGEWVFTFLGDANGDTRDPTVNEDQIIGRYTGFKIPLLGHIALAFSDFTVKVAFVAVWIALLVVIEVVPLFQNRGKEAEEGSKPL
jgi:signal peptidase